MREQKCSNPERFCDACNGFGFVVTAPNIDMASVQAMVDAGLGRRLIETAEVECRKCGGTGEDWRRGLTPLRIAPAKR